MGLSSSSGGPRISHLFFVDGSLIFVRAKKKNCQALKRISEVYEKASRYCINMAKSAMTFSLNVNNDDDQHVVLEILKLYASKPQNTYLGLPTVVGRNKYKVLLTLKIEYEERSKFEKGILSDVAEASRKQSY